MNWHDLTPGFYFCSFVNKKNPLFKVKDIGFKWSVWICCYQHHVFLAGPVDDGIAQARKREYMSRLQYPYVLLISIRWKDCLHAGSAMHRRMWQWITLFTMCHAIPPLYKGFIIDQLAPPSGSHRKWSTLHNHVISGEARPSSLSDVRPLLFTGG